jgi:phosphatidylglycerol:prolipoprotein diacylglycerol transferase
MLRYPNINPVAISVGPLHVHWYGIMYLVGFGLAWWLARTRARAPGSTWTGADVDDFVFYAMLGVIVGGRVGYVLFYGMPMWRGDWFYPLKIWQGGMSFHGGLLGVIGATALFALQRGRHVGDVFDFAAPLPGPGLFFGRMGNFINGELWGRPTDAPWGMLVPDQNGGAPVARHPSQLYEATLEGIVLFTILWLYTRRPRPRYAPAALFLICYSLARIAVEFVREPDVQIGYLAAGWFTMGQLLSLPMLLLGIGMWVSSHRSPIPSGNYARPGAADATVAAGAR